MTENRNLEEIRAEIDKLDQQLLEIFCKRMELAADVAEYKILHDLPTLRPEREKAILDRAEQNAGAEFGSYARSLFEAIMGLSRDYQNSLRNQEVTE